MKLIQARVRLFRSILDSEVVKIDDKVTCLVGKNESGKTSFLEALHRLDPARNEMKFSVPEHYPAWLEKQHRDEDVDLEKVIPVEVEFQMEANDKKHLNEKFGPKVIPANILKIGKTYENKWSLVEGSPFDEGEAVKHVANSIKSRKNIQKKIKDIETLADLKELADKLVAMGDAHPGEKTAGTELNAAIIEALTSKNSVMWLLTCFINEFLPFSISPNTRSFLIL